MKATAALAVLPSLLLAPDVPTVHSGAPLATQGLPAAPRPGPAHDIFKEDEGIWDVVMGDRLRVGGHAGLHFVRSGP